MGSGRSTTTRIAAAPPKCGEEGRPLTSPLTNLEVDEEYQDTYYENRALKNLIQWVEKYYERLTQGFNPD